MLRILIPLSNTDINPAEVAVPFEYLKEAKCEIVFATPDGKPAEADAGSIAGASVLGLCKLFQCTPEAIRSYRQLEETQEFNNPITYEEMEAKVSTFDAIFLPGGHGPGIRKYIDDERVHRAIAYFADNDKPMGGICHGVVAAAFAKSQKTGKSVLNEVNVTTLTKVQEMTAHTLTYPTLGHHFKTYPGFFAQNQVGEATGNPNKYFHQGPLFKLFQDSKANPNGFSVVDESHRFVSGRWCGDINKVSLDYIDLLRKKYPEQFVNFVNARFR